jgi:mercuric reductase
VTSVDYDLAIIGSGAAGMAAAIRAAELGANVAMVEQSDHLGGTCVNIGCIPSKFLIEAAHRYHTVRSAIPGVPSCTPDLAWHELLRRKDEIVQTLRREKYADVLAAYETVRVFRGCAELRGSGVVQVAEQEITARNILVATGARPAMAPIPGLSECGALNSTTAMEVQRLPASLIVIGGGAIGLELGQAFSRFGVRVTILEVRERMLPEEDEAVSKAVTDALSAEGIECHTGAQVTRVDRVSDGYSVHVRDGRATGELGAEQVLVATGRRPNTEALRLNAVGVNTDAGGFIIVDEFMRTSAPDVFAAGDVVRGPGLVYVAALGGAVAAQAALGTAHGAGRVPMDLAATPRVTFTDPQVAAVGLSEAEARAAGMSVKVAMLPVGYLPRAIVSGFERGVIKLVADSGSDRLLGAHIVSTNAGDIIGEATLAVRFNLSVQDLVTTLHPYLTWAEGIKLAAQTFSKDVAKLSCCA